MFLSEIVIFAGTLMLARAQLFVFFRLLWFVCHALFLLYIDGRVPHGVEWAGTGGEGFIRQIQSTIQSACNMQTILLQEYKKNRPFLLGAFLNGPMVILTRDHTPWFKTQLAKNTINFSQLQIEKLHLQHSGFKVAVDSAEFMNLVRRVFTQNSEINLAEVADEVDHSLHQYIAVKENKWTHIRCFEFAEKVATASVNRVVVGLPLCRNEDFLSIAKAPAKILFPVAIIVHCTPKVLQPIVGKICRFWSKRYWKAFERHVMPIARDVLDTHASEQNVPHTQATLMTKWASEAGRMPDQSAFLNVDKLQDVVTVANVTAVTATATSFALALLNILGDARMHAIVEDIRNEASQLFETGPSVMSLNAMSVTDSVCKESLRLENGDMFGVQGVVLKPVMTKDGILLEPGTKVSLPVDGLHRDATTYGQDALGFNPYRFCESASTGKQDLAHDVSEHYLAFSLGPHACPGRWFAIAVIKLMLGTFLLKYDVQPLKKPVQSRRLGGYLIPPLRQKIVVRKRKAVTFDMGGIGEFSEAPL